MGNHAHAWILVAFPPGPKNPACMAGSLKQASLEKGAGG